MSCSVALVYMCSPGSMMLELEQRVCDLETWTEGKAVIVQGAAGTFCSGSDLNAVRAIANPHVRTPVIALWDKVTFSLTICWDKKCNCNPRTYSGKLYYAHHYKRTTARLAGTSVASKNITLNNTCTVSSRYNNVCCVLSGWHADVWVHAEHSHKTPQVGLSEETSRLEQLRHQGSIL